MPRIFFLGLFLALLLAGCGTRSQETFRAQGIYGVWSTDRMVDGQVNRITLDIYENKTIFSTQCISQGQSAEVNADIPTNATATEYTILIGIDHVSANGAINCKIQLQPVTANYHVANNILEMNFNNETTRFHYLRPNSSSNIPIPKPKAQSNSILGTWSTQQVSNEGYYITMTMVVEQDSTTFTNLCEFNGEHAEVSETIPTEIEGQKLKTANAVDKQKRAGNIICTLTIKEGELDFSVDENYLKISLFNQEPLILMRKN